MPNFDLAAWQGLLEEGSDLPKISFEFPECVLEWDSVCRKAITRFQDGKEAHAIPHHTSEYRAHAADKSTGDVDLYCWQHDIAHCIMGLINGGVSLVLWDLAHGGDASSPACQREEDQAQAFQRAFFLRS